MGNGDKPYDPGNLKDLRDSANEAAKLCRTVYVTVLLAATYLAIAIGSTTDLMLIKDAGITLPLLNVDLPVRGFYLVAPAFLLLLHLNMLVQLQILSEKLWALDRCIRQQAWTDAQMRTERNKLYSFLFGHYLIGDSWSALTRRLLEFIVAITMVALPLALMLWALIRFLPYHSDVVTWSNRLIVIADIVAITVLWSRIMGRHWSLARRWHSIWRLIVGTQINRRHPRWGLVNKLGKLHADGLARNRRGIWAQWIPVLAGLLMLNAAAFPDDLVDRANRYLVSIVPWVGNDMGVSDKGSRLCNAQRPCDPLTYALFDGDLAPFNRNLLLREAIIVAGNPSTETIELATSDDPKKRARGLIKLSRLDLKNRDLRFADLREARMPKADLRGARVDGTRFAAAKMQGLLLSCGRPTDPPCANFKGADLFLARLQGADLRSARLQGARLQGARLQGATASSDTNLGLANIHRSARGAVSQDSAKAIAKFLDAEIKKLGKIGKSPALARGITRLKGALEQFKTLAKQADTIKRQGSLHLARAGAAWCRKTLPAGTKPLRGCKTDWTPRAYDKAVVAGVLRGLACQRREQAITKALAQRARSTSPISFGGFRLSYRAHLAAAIVACNGAGHLDTKTLAALKAIAATLKPKIPSPKKPK